jgi:hypothetical protein
MMTGPSADEAAITADREETKYLVAQQQRRALVAALNQGLPQHHHRGEGANRLPGPEHFVTTVYFDTPTLAHFHAARQDGGHHVKLRAKEYYDVHPSLAELATDDSEVLHRSPFVWLELKRRAGNRSQKQRVRIERGAVTAWLSGQARAAGEEAAAIRAYCESLSEPLAACSVVNYRRSSWQSADDVLRVTIDTDLAFFASLPEIWTVPSLSRTTLGRPRHRESNLLVEVKTRGGALPSWLEQALLEARAKPVAYSKFVRATESVYTHD